MLNAFLFSFLVLAQSDPQFCRYEVFVPTYPAEAAEKTECNGRMVLMDLSNGRDADHWWCGHLKTARGLCRGNSPR